MKTKPTVIVGLLSFVTFIANTLICCYASADDVVDDISVTVPSSCTLSGSGMTSHDAEIANGIYQPNIGTTTMNVFCNDSAGFSIYAAGFSGDVIGGENSNKLIGTSTSNYATIATGTATSAGNPDTSNWAMKLATNSQATYPITLSTGYDAYHAVPNEYTKVATRLAGTDSGQSATGASLTTTYGAYISRTQPADSYAGKVKYVLVHPYIAPAPEPCPNNEPCMRIVTPPAKTVYGNKEPIDLGGSVIKIYNPDGTEKQTVPIEDTKTYPYMSSSKIMLASNEYGSLQFIPTEEVDIIYPDGDRDYNFQAGGQFMTYNKEPYLGYGASRINYTRLINNQTDNSWHNLSYRDTVPSDLGGWFDNINGFGNRSNAYYPKYFPKNTGNYSWEVISGILKGGTRTRQPVQEITVEWEDPDTNTTFSTTYNITTIDDGE